MSTAYTISSFTAQVLASLTAGDDLTTLRGNTAVPLSLTYAPGSTVGKCDLLHAKNYTVAASGNLVLDLQGGTVADPLGVVLSAWFRVLAFALFLHPSPAGSSITIGGGSAPVGIVGDDVADEKTIYNSATGALFLWGGGETGVVVTATTADKIKVLNLDGALGVNFDLVLVGRSA